MARGRPRKFIEELLEELREKIPNLTLRTSFIVGFPGETEENFEELVQFIDEQDFERVGIFKFSREEDTPSHDLDNQIPQEVIDERHDFLMTRLQEKSRERMETYLGKTLEVLVDGVSQETDLLLEGRHVGQAPEVDGTIYINDGQAQAGDIALVEITDTHDYDLVGHITEIVVKSPPRPDHPFFSASNTIKLKTKSYRLRHISYPVGRILKMTILV